MERLRRQHGPLGMHRIPACVRVIGLTNSWDKQMATSATLWEANVKLCFAYRLSLLLFPLCSKKLLNQRPQTRDPQPQTMGHKLPTTDHQPQTTKHRP